MHDTVGISQGDRGPPARWLLLIHHIPPEPSYFRVKVRRQLQRLGAVALKNSVYILPRTDETMEDFQWLRRTVEDEGGEATVCDVRFVDGVSDAEIENLFRAAAAAEYDGIIETARSASTELTDGELERLKRRLADAAGRDFFGAERGDDARRVVRELENPRAGDRGPDVPAPAPPPRGATWVTRADVRVDRIASAWLIRRFIDPDARFRYVRPQRYTQVPGEVRFDMFEGEFAHEGDACTFEVLVRRFVPADPALDAVAELVHDVDCKDGKFGRPEAAGLSRLVQGLAAAHADDAERTRAGAVVFDAFYADFRSGQ